MGEISQTGFGVSNDVLLVYYECGRQGHCAGELSWNERTSISLQPIRHIGHYKEETISEPWEATVWHILFATKVGTGLEWALYLYKRYMERESNAAVCVASDAGKGKEKEKAARQKRRYVRLFQR